MKKQLLTFGIAVAVALSAAPEKVDFEKIRHWAGTGNNRAALIVQFDAPDESNPGALVWGFRWDDSEEATSEQMMRSIAGAASDLILLHQYTGWMGSTLDGIGYGPSTDAMLEALSFDFDGATEDGRISFGYFNPNTGMGQTSAPGQEALNLVYDAIAAAADTHVIDHPLNAREYGYPAYDYDYWKMAETPSSLWRAGWYEGYWSFWVGEGDTDNLSYSGMGMSSVEITDGQISAWKYTPLTAGADGTTGASTPWLALNYDHFDTASVLEAVYGLDTEKPMTYYRLDGSMAAEAAAGESPSLTPGIYVVRQGERVRKVFVQ